MTPTDHQSPPQRRRWRPDAMVLLIAGIIFSVLAANAAMITVAVNTQPQLVTGDYYEQGLQYDRVIAARQASRNTGWQVSVQQARDGVALHVADAQGQPVTGLAGELKLYRPDEAALDRTVPLHPGTEDAGVYVARVALKPGLWELDVDLRNAQGRLYQTVRHVVR